MKRKAGTAVLILTPFVMFGVFVLASDRNSHSESL